MFKYMIACVFMLIASLAHADDAGKGWMELTYGPHEIVVDARLQAGSDAETYVASSTLMPEGAEGASVEEALTNHLKAAEAAGKAEGLEPLRKIRTVSGTVKELGGHGGSIHVSLGLADFWFEQETFPESENLQVGDTVTITFTPNGQMADMADYVIDFKLGEWHAP